MDAQVQAPQAAPPRSRLALSILAYVKTYAGKRQSANLSYGFLADRAGLNKAEVYNMLNVAAWERLTAALDAPTAEAAHVH